MSLRPLDVRTLTPVEPRCGCGKLVSAYLYRRGTSFPATFVPLKFFESAPLKKLSRLKVGSDDDLAPIRENYQSPIGVSPIFGSPPLLETNFAGGSFNLKLVDDRTEHFSFGFRRFLLVRFPVSSVRKWSKFRFRSRFSTGSGNIFRDFSTREVVSSRRASSHRGFVPLRHRLRVADKA